VGGASRRSGPRQIRADSLPESGNSLPPYDRRGKLPAAVSEARSRFEPAAVRLAQNQPLNRKLQPQLPATAARPPTALSRYIPPGRPDVVTGTPEPVPLVDDVAVAAGNDTTDPPDTAIVPPVAPPAGDASCSASKSMIART